MCTMSDSNSTHRSRRRAARNPYSQTVVNESYAAFLASRGLPVPDSLKRPSERPSGSNKRRKHGDHESNPEVCSRRLVYTHISSFQTLQLTSGSSESMMSINLTITKCLHLKYMIHLITEAQRLHFNKSHQKIFLQAQVHLTMTWTSV